MKKLKLGEKVLLLCAEPDECGAAEHGHPLDFTSLCHESGIITAQPIGSGSYYEVEMADGVYGEYERCYLVGKSDLSRLQKTFDRISKAVKAL